PPESTSGYRQGNLWFRVVHTWVAEKHGFVVALQMDVEDQAFAISLGNQRFCAIAERRQSRIVFKTLGLWNVCTGVELTQQATGKDDDVNERGPALLSGAWLYGSEPVRAHFIGGASAPAGESEGIPDQRAILFGDIAVFVGLPDFNHGIWDRSAFAVKDGTGQLDRAVIRRRDKMVAIFEWQVDLLGGVKVAEEGANGLARCWCQVMSGHGLLPPSRFAESRSG